MFQLSEFYGTQYSGFPLLRWLCDVDSTGFNSIFQVLKTWRGQNLLKLFSSCWIEKNSLQKLLLVCVPVFVIVKKNPSSKNLILRCMLGIVLVAVSVVAANGHNGCS